MNNFSTYIDDPKHIPILLGYGWIVIKETWTDCPQRIYNRLKEETPSKEERAFIEAVKAKR